MRRCQGRLPHSPRPSSHPCLPALVLPELRVTQLRFVLLGAVHLEKRVCGVALGLALGGREPPPRSG